MDPKATWKRNPGHADWIADVGPFRLSVVPSNAMFCNSPNPYRGLCRILIHPTGALVWKEQFTEKLFDVPDLMCKAEEEFQRRLAGLALFAWEGTSAPEPAAIEMQDEKEMLQSLWKTAPARNEWEPKFGPAVGQAMQIARSDHMHWIPVDGNHGTASTTHAQGQLMWTTVAQSPAHVSSIGTSADDGIKVQYDTYLR